MKKWIIGFIAIIFIIFLIFIANQTFLGNSAIDIHLHDTYFVVTNTTLFLIIFLVLSFLISLIASLISKFRKPIFNWILFLSSLGILALFVYYYILFRKIL
jgi:heme/copper-type cytochrome/quinol oxidase subunit 1